MSRENLRCSRGRIRIWRRRRGYLDELVGLDADVDDEDDSELCWEGLGGRTSVQLVTPEASA